MRENRGIAVITRENRGNREVGKKENIYKGFESGVLSVLVSYRHFRIVTFLYYSIFTKKTPRTLAGSKIRQKTTP